MYTMYSFRLVYQNCITTEPIRSAMKPDQRNMPRRDALKLFGAGTVVGFAGCSGSLGSGSGSVPDPVDLSGGKFDYQGGMEIGAHGGPNGQIFYAVKEPEPAHGSASPSTGESGLAWFHTLVHGLFPYHFDRSGRGWEADVIYVTDYSAVEWEPSGQPPQLPSPTAAGTFGEATELTYVADSNVIGGMGPTLVPFSNSSDAETFVTDYGGQSISFENINRELVSTLQTTEPN